MAEPEQRYMHPATDKFIMVGDDFFHLEDLIDWTNPADIRWKVTVAGLGPIIIPGLTVVAPVQVNIDMPVIGTIYNFSIPTAAKRFRIKARAINSTTDISYDAAMVAYETLFMGSSLEEAALALPAPLTIYFRSTTVVTVAEITYWI